VEQLSMLNLLALLKTHLLVYADPFIDEFGLQSGDRPQVMVFFNPVLNDVSR
jgi:hypothetical protein